MARPAERVTVHRAFVDGEWFEPDGMPTQVVNPATGKHVGTVHDTAFPDIDRAVAAAARAGGLWASTSMEARMRLVGEIRDGIAERRQELAASLTAEMGAPIRVTSGQMVDMAIADADSYLAAAAQLPKVEQFASAVVLREPVGVVAAITPWNAPVHEIAMKVFPALLAGCAVVLKPSEISPTAAGIFAEVVAAAGAPQGLISLITGTGPTVGEYLACHPGVQLVAFTGSVDAGLRVAALCAASFKRSVLELGGKSSCIVLEDADLDEAVSWAVGTCMSNSGQICVAMSLILVPRLRLAEAEQAAAAAAAKWIPADPALPETRMGPVASEAQRARVERFLREAVADGARLAYRGQHGSTIGAFVSPAIVADVRPSMTIAQEEIFGPVACLLGYDDEQEALNVANGTGYGLAAAVWSKDPSRAMRLATRLEAGVIRINGGGSEFGAPFGGRKNSGIGRAGGRYGLEEYFELKTVSGPDDQINAVCAPPSMCRF